MFFCYDDSVGLLDNLNKHSVRFNLGFYDNCPAFTPSLMDKHYKAMQFFKTFTYPIMYLDSDFDTGGNMGGFPRPGSGWLSSPLRRNRNTEICLFKKNNNIWTSCLWPLSENFFTSDLS